MKHHKHQLPSFLFIITIQHIHKTLSPFLSLSFSLYTAKRRQLSYFILFLFSTLSSNASLINCSCSNFHPFRPIFSSLLLLVIFYLLFLAVKDTALVLSFFFPLFIVCISCSLVHSRHSHLMKVNIQKLNFTFYIGEKKTTTTTTPTITTKNINNTTHTYISSLTF